MADFTIQEKINSYVAKHSELKGKGEKCHIVCHDERGIVTQAEIDSAKKTSAFGYGFNKTENIGLSVEKSTLPNPKTVKIQPQAVQVTEFTEKQAQDYAIETIGQNMEEALSIYMSVDNGAISKR